MKKQKKKLQDLQVTSFTTNSLKVTGGTNPVPIGTGHCCSGTVEATVCW